MTATTGQCKIRPIVWDPQMLLFHVRLCQASGANCTGTHAEAGWDRPASRGTQNIRSAQAICAALSPHIKNPKSGTRMLQFSPPWMESNSSPHSQNVTLPLQRIKSEAQTYNLLPGHSFIQSQQTWQSRWIIQKKKKKKNKERTRLWTVGDASVLTPFQPPPPSFIQASAQGTDTKMNWFLGQKGGAPINVQSPLTTTTIHFQALALPGTPAPHFGILITEFRVTIWPRGFCFQDLKVSTNYTKKPPYC